MRRKLASILQFLPKASQQDKRPANALIAKAVEICETKGISHLDLWQVPIRKQNARVLWLNLRSKWI